MADTDGDGNLTAQPNVGHSWSTCLYDRICDHPSPKPITFFTWKEPCKTHTQHKKTNGGYMSIDEGFDALVKHLHQTTGREAIDLLPCACCAGGVNVIRSS